MQESNISSEYLLNLLQEDDTIDVDEALNLLNMKKKIQHAKKIHPYPIHHTEKSGYYTVVDDATASDGKRKIRKAHEETLWEALGDWYSGRLERNTSFEKLYETWIEWKKTPRNRDTIKRIVASWNAYYKNEPLSKDIIKKPVSRITSIELREWAESLLKQHYPVDKKKFSRMFSIMNQCFEYASDEDIALVPVNVWQKARKKLNKDLIVSPPPASDESQVFTDEERHQLKRMIHEDLERYKKQSSSAGLQILFLFETGLRIGECCGLKWTDIRNNRLYIQRQANNEQVKEWTKSWSGYRDIPLTREARRILEEVDRFNREHGYTAEWIFQSNNPDYDYRLGYNAADRKLRKLCKRMDSLNRSPHKCRKTCISTLLDSPEINKRTVQRFAGHKDLTTTYNYYQFDRKSKEEQAEAIDRALAV